MDSTSNRVRQIWRGLRNAGLALACVAAASLPGSRARYVLDIAWMAEDFSAEIEQALPCQPLGILVSMQGYATGEAVDVTLHDTGDSDFETRLQGRVDADGKARLLWNPCEDDTPGEDR